MLRRRGGNGRPDLFLLTVIRYFLLDTLEKKRLRLKNSLICPFLGKELFPVFR